MTKRKAKKTSHTALTTRDISPRKRQNLDRFLAERTIGDGWAALVGAWSGKNTRAANIVYAGWRDAMGEALGWINTYQNQISGKRIIQLRNDLAEVERLSALPPEQNAFTVYHGNKLAHGSEESARALAKAHQRIYHRLNSYYLHPRITWISTSRKWWLDFYTLPLEDDSGLRVEVPQLHTVYESDVAMVLASLAQRGDIARVRRCEVCHKWFYAKVISAKRCSRQCTERRQDSDPNFKKSRADYMKEYRRGLRRRNPASLASPPQI